MKKMAMFKNAFTLAEVLITLAIIGVVAAISIPSVVANTQQKEFQTGLRKAVSVLNSAITMNMAIDGESPYDTGLLYTYLMRHMSVMKSMIATPAVKGERWPNVAFYTTDGMRFEFPEKDHVAFTNLKMHENPDLRLRGGFFTHAYTNADSDGNYGIDNIITRIDGNSSKSSNQSWCGSYGLSDNSDNTTTTPCIVIVDVNGDRKPFPNNVSCNGMGDTPVAHMIDASGCANIRKYSDVNARHLTDTFAIMITDKKAIPFGVAAQKAMYAAQK